MNRFVGKIVLVTGGSRNTGLEIVDLFLREGARVFFCGTSSESVEKGSEELSRRGLSGFTGIVCNVGEKSSVEAMMDRIATEVGRLDIVISNAANMGVGHGDTLEMTEEMLFDTLNVNLGGTFRVVQTAARRFFVRQPANEATGQRGVVVCIGSNTSERVSRKRLAYVTSKGGLDAMVRAFATDLGPLGIRVNMVAPGYIRTDRWAWLPEDVQAKRRSNTVTGRESDGHDVAEAAAFLASDAARTFQGARLVMDSGSSIQLYPASCEDDTSNMRMK